MNPDDEVAEQRYDAFGKTALWYVAEAGPDAKLFLGFKREVSAEEFWRKCQDGTVEELLNVVKPQVGAHYLVTPGMVHAAQDVRLLEIAESSELWFRLHAWDDPEAELHLEEAFDLIDFKPYRIAAPKGNPEAVTEKIAVTPQFSVSEIRLASPLRIGAENNGSFLLYACVNGAGSLEVEGVLVFFMLSSNFVPLRGIEVNLPRTGGRLTYTARNFVVTIDKDSRIYFNDAVVKGADELKRRLSESLSARGFRPDKERIIVRCDVNAPLSTVAEVLTVAEELNVSVLFMSGGQPKSRTASFTEPES